MNLQRRKRGGWKDGRKNRSVEENALTRQKDCEGHVIL